MQTEQCCSSLLGPIGWQEAGLMAVPGVVIDGLLPE